MTVTPNARPKAALLAAATAGIALVGALASGAGPAAATPSAPSTHAVHVRGVTLRVPSAWHLTSHDEPAGCIVDPVAPEVTARQAAYGQNDCQLQVLTGATLPASATPDRRYSPGDPAQCLRGSGSVDRRTVAASAARVGGIAAEYRRFALACSNRPSEQWFVARQPGVLIQRSRMSSGTEAAARRAVASAVLPHGHGLPRAYVGTPRGAGHATVLLARTRVSYGTHGRATAAAAGGRTRLFTVPASIRVDYARRGGGVTVLNRAQFLHGVRHGFPHSGALQPEVSIHSAVGSSHPSITSVALASPR